MGSIHPPFASRAFLRTLAVMEGNEFADGLVFILNARSCKLYVNLPCCRGTFGNNPVYRLCENTEGRRIEGHLEIFREVSGNFAANEPRY